MTPTVFVLERALDRIARASEVPATLCPIPDDVRDGVVVTLVSRRIGALGLAVADRSLPGWRLMARATEGIESIDDAFLDRRLETAMALRARHGVLAGGSAYRLLNAAGDGLPGVVCDVYGDVAVVSALSDALVPLATDLAHRLVDKPPVRGVVVKRRQRGGAATGPGVVAVIGDAPPERHIVHEGAWRFEVHLTTGVNVGLFTDMRLERQRIAGVALGRRVLNLFAYTGSLSIAAASGGATDVTSVDLSAGVLAWARDHFALNGLAEHPHHTIADDALRFVTAAAARGERFGLVLVDPPSYSAARDAAFTVDRDYAPLVAAACGVLDAGGDLWLASNTRGFSLVSAAHAGVLAAGRQATVVAEGGLPPDYPTELSDVDARYLQTCLLRVV